MCAICYPEPDMGNKGDKGQDNLLVLLPSGQVARRMRALQKAHYEACGDFSPYSLPVCIVLGRCASPHFDRRTFHLDALFSSDDVVLTDFGYALHCSADLAEIQRSLSIEETASGLFFSKERPVFTEDFSFKADRFTLAMLTPKGDGGYLLLQ